MIDFAQTAEQSEPINLRWSQELAASWSLLWPSVVATYLLLKLMGVSSVRAPTTAYLVGRLILLAAQAALAPRLVRKNYGSFFIGVLREGEPLNRAFSWSEQVSVSMQLLWPYLAFLVGALLLAAWLNTYHLSRDTREGIASLMIWFLILMVGPSAIRSTMYAKYRGFRLQAFRQKRKLNPAWSSIRNDQTEDEPASSIE